MTDGMTPVDGARPETLVDLWVPIAELARMKGVSKQAISKKVERYASQGLVETRPGERGAKLVSPAQYDRADGKAGDAIRTLAQAPQAKGIDDPILAREQARRVQYQADIAKLDLDERLGKLLPVEEVTTAMARCAEALTRAIDQLPSRADDLSAAVAREGALGARTFLKGIARELRAALAKEMRLLEADGANEETERTEP